MRTKLLHIFLLFFVGSSSAHNLLPVDRDRLLPVLKKLPVEVSFDSLTIDHIPILPKKQKQTFHFPEVDEAIEAQLKERQSLLMVDDPDPIDGIEDFLDDIYEKANDYNVNEYVKDARAIIQEAIAVGNFIKRLEEGELVTLPLVLSDTISNVVYTLAIKSVKLKPAFAELEVYMGIEVPDKDITLYFGSPNVKFTAEGGIVGENVLGLYSEVPIPIGGQKSALLLKPYRRNPNVNPDTDPDDPNLHLGTFVKIDCDGFKGMGVDAEIHFSRDWIRPTNAAGEITDSSRVVGRIQTYIDDWNDLLAVVDLPNFALTKHPDMQFQLSNAVFDFSDYRNDPSVLFPDEYTEQNLLPNNKNLWRGVYIQDIRLTLPKVFKKKECIADSNDGSEQDSGGGSGSIQLPIQEDYRWTFSEQIDRDEHGPSALDVIPPYKLIEQTTNPSCRMSFGAKHLLIDQMGVSGEFYATNILSINEGVIDKWSFSIDSINVDVVINKITGFGFSGGIAIPIADKQYPFFYSAFIDDADNYSFALGTSEDAELPLWKAGKVLIKAGSKLQVDVVDDKFSAHALLSGHMSIGLPTDDNDPDSKKLVEAPDIQFHKLWLGTQAPYIGIIEDGYFRIDQELKFAGFPVSIDDIGFRKISDGKCGLDFSIKIILAKDEDYGFVATGGFSLIGKIRTENKVQTWDYESFEFREAEVLLVLPKVKAYGFLKLIRGDETFGNGFQAGLMMEVMDGKFTVEASALFGKTLDTANQEGFRYWYVDGFATFSPAITIAGPLALNGFGGGLYHHMKLVNYDPSYTGLGASISGCIYRPDKSITFGLKASVGLITTKPMDSGGSGQLKSNGTLVGTATLEFAFGNGGLQYVGFLATATFLQGGDGNEESSSSVAARIKERSESLGLTKEQTKNRDKNKVKSPVNDIKATLFIVMDFTQGFDLNAMLAVYMNVANGKVRGIGDNGLVGAAHFMVKNSVSPKQWHIYIGGYFNPPVYVEGFDGQPFHMSPVGVRISEDPFSAEASAFFMVGNDIPGPPGIPDHVAREFHVSQSELVQYDDIEGRFARGTGFAFGADFYLQYRYYKKRRRGLCKKTKIKIRGGVGFSIALLKYKTGAYCYQNGKSPVGMKGWRASGNIYAYVKASGKMRCVPIPRIGVGVLLMGDAPNPAYLNCKVKVFGLRFGFQIGDRCTIMAGGGDF